MPDELWVDGGNLFDPNTNEDEFDGTFSAAAMGFGESRDFGLDFGGANGILKTFSSSFGAAGVGLFNRASILASGLK